MKRLAFLVVAMCACGDSTPAQPDAGLPEAAPPPAPELGTGDHSPSSVTLTPIATAADGLAAPRDLAFNPLRPDELWIVNHGTETMVIVHSATDDTNRTSEKRKDGYALHFMAKPASIDFGADATSIGKPGTFGTCGESRNTYDDTQTADDFMGPVLWSSDLSVFAKMNPNGLGSHLDMLHLSSNCIGITHEANNAFWAISGRSAASTMPMSVATSAVTRYDFLSDNGIGNDDHSDGEGQQFAVGQIGYKPGVSSHLFWNPDESVLYIADAGNGRVIRLDPSTATKGKALMTPEPMKLAVQMAGETITEVISPGSTVDAVGARDPQRDDLRIRQRHEPNHGILDGRTSAAQLARHRARRWVAIGDGVRPRRQALLRRRDGQRRLPHRFPLTSAHTDEWSELELEPFFHGYVRALRLPLEKVCEEIARLFRLHNDLRIEHR